MKIERIKKSHKKEIIIGGLILVSIVSAITLVTTRAKYQVTQNIKLAQGTVNYKPYDFKIMAMYQQNDSETYTEIQEMPTSGYAVNEEKSYCTTDNKTQVKGKIKTIDGNHVISNLKKSDKCYIWFDKYVEPTASEIILANITITDETPDFTQIATTDEGVHKVEDGMYGETSYYFRGAVTNNYVKFANKCWRIVRINGDESIRLIYDGTTCHANSESTSDSIAVTSQKYNTSYDKSEQAGWTYDTGSQRPTNNETVSNAKIQTESWFNTNITGTDLEKVTTGKFCNDRNTASGYTWSSQPSSTFYYAGYDRSGAKSASSVMPTLSCPEGDVYTLKAGAITVDEVILAGGKWNLANTNYYLYNGQFYWTMSPSYWCYNSSSRRWAYVFFVHSAGGIGAESVSNPYNIRPVINLRSDVTFSSGDGTQNNPYVVS